MSDSIVVTGATGRQGGAVARPLAKAGAQVRALVRDPSSPRARPLTQFDQDITRALVQEPVRLRAADAELRTAVRLPRAVAEREPHPSGVSVADPGGQHRRRAPDIVHRLTQPVRHLPVLRRAQRRPRRFGDIVLVVVAVTPSSAAPAGRTRAYGKHGRPFHLTAPQITASTWGNAL